MPAVLELYKGSDEATRSNLSPYSEGLLTLRRDELKDAPQFVSNHQLAAEPPMDGNLAPQTAVMYGGDDAQVRLDLDMTMPQVGDVVYHRELQFESIGPCGVFNLWLVEIVNSKTMLNLCLHNAVDWDFRYCRNFAAPSSFL
jgi:hypothetical protein